MGEISIEQLREESVTQVVGLGGSCSVAHNLRRFYNFNSANLFDWWITPLHGVVLLLNELKNKRVIDSVYSAENLTLTDRSASVKHVPTDILLHHEFPRDWSMEGVPIMTGWGDHINKAKSRSEYLANKLLSYNNPNERILFVRAPDSSPDLNKIIGELFHHALWSLVVVPNFSTADSWKGDPDLWDDELRKIGVSIRQDLHRPFIDTGAYHNGEEFSKISD